MACGADCDGLVLVELGIELAYERDTGHLLDRFVEGARSLAGADGATLYLTSDDGERLAFAVVTNVSLGIAAGGTTGVPVPFPPVPLRSPDGPPNRSNVASLRALTGTTIAIGDAYSAEGFDFSGTRAFDAGTGYRSVSLLAVPLVGHDGEVLGVLQLINALPADGDPVPFPPSTVRTVEALAGMAGIALDNRRLIDGHKALFNGIVRVLSRAIDAKSPYTGGHCDRVPHLAAMIARAACDSRRGRSQGFRSPPRSGGN